MPIVAFILRNEIWLLKKTRDETRLAKEEKTKKVKPLEKLQKCAQKIPFQFPSCALFLSFVIVLLGACSYKKAAKRAPKPRTPAEAKVTRPAEESALPVD
jgi:hypothetical protein